MTKQERLDLYEKALKDYEYAFKNPDQIEQLYVGLGFCYYFSNMHNIRVYYDDIFEKDFPELYQQRTTDEDVSIWHYTDIGYAGVKERIKALKKAIKLCKQ